MGQQMLNVLLGGSPLASQALLLQGHIGQSPLWTHLDAKRIAIAKVALLGFPRARVHPRRTERTDLYTRPTAGGTSSGSTMTAWVSSERLIAPAGHIIKQSGSSHCWQMVGTAMITPSCSVRTIEIRAREELHSW